MPLKIRKRLTSQHADKDTSPQTFARVLLESPIGANPRNVPIDEMLGALRNQGDEPRIQKYYDRVTSPLTAIRARCVDCAGGVAEVRKCPAIECPNWCFRLGTNPFFGKLRETNDESDEG